MTWFPLFRLRGLRGAHGQAPAGRRGRIAQRSDDRPPSGVAPPGRHDRRGAPPHGRDPGPIPAQQDARGVDPRCQPGGGEDRRHEQRADRDALERTDRAGVEACHEQIRRDERHPGGCDHPPRLDVERADGRVHRDDERAARDQGQGHHRLADVLLRRGTSREGNRTAYSRKPRRSRRRTRAPVAGARPSGTPSRCRWKHGSAIHPWAARPRPRRDSLRTGHGRRADAQHLAREQLERRGGVSRPPSFGALISTTPCATQDP